jgi:DNA helicase HerA-like ATPase
MAIQDVREVFVPNRVARLMKMEENEQTRYQYEIWFEYTRQTMTELREGTLVAVRNFATNRDETHYSVLEVVSLMPVHYALGESPNGYPGFVMEAARNITTDWTSQEDRSDEDTTIIRCVAIPTGIEISESHSGRDLDHDRALPMVGGDVRVLTHDATQEIVNREISPTSDVVCEAGTWLVDDRVPIYMRTEDFVRLHFGIFGFTGAGKSNVVSTYVDSLLRTAQQRTRPVKVVLFDLMGEYGVLLLDRLLTLSHAWVLAIGERTLPGSVVDFLSGRSQQRQAALSHLVGSTLFPRALESVRDTFANPFDTLLTQRKIRLFQPRVHLVREFLEENERALTGGNLGGSKGIILNFLEGLRQRFGNQPLTPTNAQTLLREVQQVVQQQGANLTATASNNLSGFRRLLEEVSNQPQVSIPAEVSLSFEQIVHALNDESESCLLVVQAHDPDELRDFAFDLGRELYEFRRRRGIIHPLVSFVFDEADEFIPFQVEKDSSYSRSAWVVEALARRGRKFGIGVGICTQRVRYLKTSVMAQPHTYLVSKMPRLTDRQAIQEAFGFSEEMFRQTFKFAPGDWLLVSHDATGLKAVPIPIHAPDANERIRQFLASRFPAGQARR